MPRNVRNFWLTAHVDGKDQPVSFGPQGKDGGFTLNVEQRDDGQVTGVARLTGRFKDGNLILDFEPTPAGEALQQRIPVARSGRIITRRDK